MISTCISRKLMTCKKKVNRSMSVTFLLSRIQFQVSIKHHESDFLQYTVHPKQKEYVSLPSCGISIKRSTGIAYVAQSLPLTFPRPIILLQSFPTLLNQEAWNQIQLTMTFTTILNLNQSMSLLYFHLKKLFFT